MTDLNPTSRKYPRTLQEAFGHDTWQWIDEVPDRMSTHDKVMVVLSLVAYAVLGYVFFKM